MSANSVDIMVTARHPLIMAGVPTPAPPPERRQRPRSPIRLQLTVDCHDGHAREAVTRDASEVGISFYCDSPIPAGARIAFAVKVPREVASHERIHVRGEGTVVRSEELPLGRCLIAASTDAYSFNE
jgi:PilZ domain